MTTNNTNLGYARLTATTEHLHLVIEEAAQYCVAQAIEAGLYGTVDIVVEDPMPSDDAHLAYSLGILGREIDESALADARVEFCKAYRRGIQEHLDRLPSRSSAEILVEHGVVDDDHCDTDELCSRLRSVGATNVVVAEFRCARESE